MSEDDGGGASLVRTATGTVVGAASTAIRGGKAFGLGSVCIFRGAKRLVVTPWLWRYALAPAVLAFVMFVGCFWWFWSVGVDWAKGLAAGWMGETGGLVAGILAGLAILAAALLLFYVAFPSLVRIVAAPFLALLADRVYEDVAGRAPPAYPGTRFRRWIVMPIRDAIMVVGIRLVVTCIALPLNFIPVLGQAAFFAVLLPLEGLDLLDLGLSARAVPLKERLVFTRRNLAAASGLGMGSAAVLFIPVVNVFFLPSLVVGAVLLDAEISPDFAPGDTAPGSSTPEEAA